MKARAPGKIILSGEHAVVYGNPALVAAVDRYVEAESVPRKDRLLTVSLNDQPTEEFSLSELPELRKRVSRWHEQFLQGELPVSEVVTSPGELLAFAVAGLPPPCDGFDLKINSDVPIGCGMGASAAVILSALYTAGPLERPAAFEMALQAENLQHGRSSGVDPYTCLYGGCIRYSLSAKEKLSLQVPPLMLVHTGRPECSTGECVDQVRRNFSESDIWKNFAACTESMQQALMKQNTEQFLKSIRRNNRLLGEIGVVPAKVADFIFEIERCGGAAKICGAGAVSGDAGGMVLAVGGEEVNKEINASGYEAFPVHMDTNGTHCI